MSEGVKLKVTRLAFLDLVIAREGGRHDVAFSKELVAVT